MKKFEQDLAALQTRLVEMWDLTESMLALATAALSKQESDPSEEVLQREDQLDRMQVEIDHDAVRLLTVYSPVATDLRFVLSVSHVNMALERIGDQAVNLCEDLQLMFAKSDVPPLPKLLQMAKLVNGIVHDALSAYLARDVDKAQETIKHDDRVDALNEEIVRELLSDEFVREVLSGSQDMGGAMAQILIARSLERIADQANNICEQAVYAVKGDDIRHTRD
jgi:phosphate transport system protein